MGKGKGRQAGLVWLWLCGARMTTRWRGLRASRRDQGVAGEVWIKGDGVGLGGTDNQMVAWIKGVKVGV